MFSLLTAVVVSMQPILLPDEPSAGPENPETSQADELNESELATVALVRAWVDTIRNGSRERAQARIGEALTSPTATRTPRVSTHARRVALKEELERELSDLLQVMLQDELPLPEIEMTDYDLEERINYIMGKMNEARELSLKGGRTL